MRRVVFRVFPFNRLSFPVLLNAWEQRGLDGRFEIIIREQPLSAAPVQPIDKGDVVIFSFMTPHLPIIHREMEALKGSGAIIAGGGPHISGSQELVLEMGFDVLFAGTGEENFLRFGRDLLDNSFSSSLSFPMVYRAAAADSGELNRYFPSTKYLKGAPPLEIMRGCFWNCNYCATGSRKMVLRELDSIVAYLQEVKKKGINRINYICPSSMEYGAPRGRKLDLAKIEELLRITKTFDLQFIEFGIFPSEIRPDTVTTEGMAILRKYVSHKAVTIGAQSGCDSRLRQLKRAHTTADVEAAIAIANENGFLAILDFIVAYPDETPEERELTLNFIDRLNKTYRVRTQLHHFFPLSGSTYEYRFPSFMSEQEKNKLHALKKAGITRDGWVANEKQTSEFFHWLKGSFPRYYCRYR